MPSGGKRPGSGRKSIYPAGRMADYVVTLPPELHATAAQLGGGNVSAGVRLALQEAAGRSLLAHTWTCSPGEESWR
jgi:hypothetical protein